MTVGNDLTAGLTAELKQALGERAAGQDRTRRLDTVLAAVERALGKRLTDGSDPVEPDPDHVRALLPSPGLERRARELHEQMFDILRTVRSLRTEVASSTEPRDGSVDARLHDLALTLERHEHGEIDLVQAGMTPDI